MRRHLTTGQRAMTAAALGVRGSGSHKRFEEGVSIVVRLTPRASACSS